MYAVYGVSIKPLRKRRPPHPERKKTYCCQYNNVNKSTQRTMVLILDGTSDIGAHV